MLRIPAKPPLKSSSEAGSSAVLAASAKTVADSVPAGEKHRTQNVSEWLTKGKRKQTKQIPLDVVLNGQRGAC